MITNILKNFNIKLNPYLCIILIIIYSAILAKALFYIQPENIFGFVEYEVIVIENALLNELYLYNFLPVLILTLLIYFITANFSVTLTISTFIFILLGFVNRYKIFLRQDPLVPTDFALGKEVFEIVGNMDISSIQTAILAIFAILIVGILASVLIRTRKMNLIFRISAIVIMFSTAYFLNNSVYSNEAKYATFPVDGNQYFLVNQYNSKGFLYSLLVQNNSFKVKIPADYNANTLSDYITSVDYVNTEKIEEVNPHIFIIMGEAFSDISEHSKINFNGFTDPLENFKNLKKDSLSGYIFTPNMGGGTADTEFDVLTGLSTRELQLKPYSYRFINSEINSIPSWLKKIGYNTIAIHPGNDWFYNRINAYPYLGFDQAVFDDAFDEEFAKKYGEVWLSAGYINEVSTYDMIIDRFEQLKTENPNEPTLNFCVTIESHGPYNWKYPDIETNFNSEIPLSEEYTKNLSNYFRSITNMDIQLERLTKYLDDLDEPAVLLYFGDHMPGLPTEIFYELEYDMADNGTFDQKTFLYQTPYLIWQNSSYKNEFDIVEYAKELEIPTSEYHINTSYLGTTFMKLIGYENGFINHSNETRKFYPLTTLYEYINAEGEEFNSAAETIENVEYITKYLEWQYYELFK